MTSLTPCYVRFLTVKDEFRLKMKMTDVKQTIIGRHPQSPFTSVELKMMLS